jgi:uncharacterized protein
VIVLDTSGLLAALDAEQPDHEAARTSLERDRGPFVLSPYVLAELDFLLATRVGMDAEVALLREVSSGAYRLEAFSPEDVEDATEVIERYRDLRLGLADASVVVLAHRHRTTRILTLDEWHFRALRPLSGRAFRLLPSDG